MVEEVSPLCSFSKRFWRAINYTWRDLFFAHKSEYKDELCVQGEIEKELQWAQNRPSSRTYHDDPVSIEDPLCFRKTLTSTEEMFLLTYSLKWPDAAYQLNQNPDTSFETHSSGKALATLVRNMGIVYWDGDLTVPGRWITGTEAVCSQGFPVHPEVIRAMPEGTRLCSFHTKLESRSTRHMWCQAGNSMNCLVIGLLDLHALLCWRHVSVPGLLSSIRAGRLFRWSEEVKKLQAAAFPMSLERAESDETGREQSRSKKQKTTSISDYWACRQQDPAAEAAEAGSASASASAPRPVTRLTGKQEDTSAASLAFALRRQMLLKGKRQDHRVDPYQLHLRQIQFERGVNGGA